jgi:hypothetical protein
MSANEFDVVTSTFGYSGKYITHRLLELYHAVHMLTYSTNHTNLFGKPVEAFPFQIRCWE